MDIPQLSMIDMKFIEDMNGNISNVAGLNQEELVKSIIKALPVTVLNYLLQRSKEKESALLLKKPYIDKGVCIYPNYTLDLAKEPSITGEIGLDGYKHFREKTFAYKLCVYLSHLNIPYRVWYNEIRIFPEEKFVSAAA